MLFHTLRNANFPCFLHPHHIFYPLPHFTLPPHSLHNYILFVWVSCFPLCRTFLFQNFQLILSFSLKHWDHSHSQLSKACSLPPMARWKSLSAHSHLVLPLWGYWHLATLPHCSFHKDKGPKIVKSKNSHTTADMQQPLHQLYSL